MVELGGVKYFTALEVAGELEVTKTYICRLAREGKLNHIRTELGYFFPDGFLDAWQTLSHKRRNK